MATVDDLIAEGITALNSEDISKKLSAISFLGRIDDRRIYPILIEQIVQADLTPDVIVALAQLKDSRALFPLINYFNSNPVPNVAQRLLQYCYYTRDPRAVDFLQQYFSEKRGNFLEIAEFALEKCKDNYDFTYRYVGPDSSLEKAKKAEGQLMVSNSELDSASRIFEECASFVPPHPQTYIVNCDEEMLIGGLLSEHTEVARGEDVYAAGEVTFRKVENNWQVEYINNRSNGYLPAGSSFHWVKKFFEKSAVIFDKKQFDEVFPQAGYNDSDFLARFKFSNQS